MVDVQGVAGRVLRITVSVSLRSRETHGAPPLNCIRTIASQGSRRVRKRLRTTSPLWLGRASMSE